MIRNFSILALVSIALAIAAPASAQCPPDVQLRAQRELDATDARIEQADQLVTGSDNLAAQTKLAEATRIQAQAKVEFAAGHCRIAIDLTLRARLRASEAIAIIRGLPDFGLPDPGRVLSQLERTRELLDRARDRIEECNNDRAHSMLRAALEMQDRADGAFAHERYLAALQLTVSARERAHRALRLCNLEENLHDSAEHALARTDEVIRRATDQARDKNAERTRQMLARAVEIQERAQAEFRAEHFEASLRLTLSARTIAYRVIRMSGGAS